MLLNIAMLLKHRLTLFEVTLFGVTLFEVTLFEVTLFEWVGSNKCFKTIQYCL